MMKKGLYMLIATMLCMVACQPIANKEDKVIETTTRHQTFKGIEIDSTAEVMMDTLVQMGYHKEKLKRLNNKYALRGNFAGYNNCMIMLNYTFKNQIVYEVMVGLPKRETWIELKQDYEQLKGRLTQKYGEPTECNEFFMDEDDIEDDEMRYWEVKNEKYDYHSIFETELGWVRLEIQHTDEIGFTDICWVVISYRDRKNYEMFVAESDNDL